LLFILFLPGCSSNSDYNISVKTEPKYKAGSSYPIAFEVTKDGQPVPDLKIIASLEMAKMDHGSIELTLTDQGGGLYESSVELPMAGEWIANIEAGIDGETIEKVITFDVEVD
jgi:nitrogen fixation protein FixH